LPAQNRVEIEAAQFGLTHLEVVDKALVSLHRPLPAQSFPELFQSELEFWLEPQSSLF